MVHGTPDWGLKKKSTVYALDDMAELAVRLGSIVSFDRRGDVSFVDDFEGGAIRWQLSPVPTLFSWAASTDTARNGGISGLLTTRAAANVYGFVYRGAMISAISPLGLEASFCLDSTDSAIQVELERYDGTTRYYPYVRYHCPTGKIYIIGANAVEQEIASGVYVRTGPGYFSTLKLVVDFANKKYVRLIFGETTHLLSAYGMPSTADTSAPSVEPRLYGAATVAAAKKIYFDDVILTQNEPT